MSLLDKAVSPQPVEYSDEDLLELALAWVTGKVRQSQASKALQKSNTLTNYHLGNALRRAYADGLIIIKRKSP